MTTNEIHERLMTRQQVAERLNVSFVTVGRWLREGKLTGVKAGRQWRIEKNAIENFLKEGHGMKKVIKFSPTKARDFLELLFEVRDSDAWSTFKPYLYLVMFGTPEQIQTFRRGDFEALEGQKIGV